MTPWLSLIMLQVIGAFFAPLSSPERIPEKATITSQGRSSLSTALRSLVISSGVYVGIFVRESFLRVVVFCASLNDPSVLR